LFYAQKIPPTVSALGNTILSQYSYYDISRPNATIFLRLFYILWNFRLYAQKAARFASGTAHGRRIFLHLPSEKEKIPHPFLDTGFGTASFASRPRSAGQVHHGARRMAGDIVNQQYKKTVSTTVSLKK